MIENTPFVIDRYRETTAALATPATACINSLSDISMMALGFFARAQAAALGLDRAVVVLEIVPLFVIRDNLTLNIWNLLAPNPAVAAWQARG